MRTQTNSGFTIIEVMLFLAITGALTVAILVSSGVAIGQQRYKDSVNSFKGLVQEQYGQIANVVNSETQNPRCSRSEDEVSFDQDDKDARGTSDCLIMGRFLLVQGDMVTAYNLIGEPDTSVSGDDIAVLRSYGFALQSPEIYEVNWGARIVEPGTANDSLSSVLIVRSPISGSILTFTDQGDRKNSLKDMINSEKMKPRVYCVDSGGGSFLPNQRAVRIAAKAANQSAIDIPLESEGVCEQR